MKVESLNCGCLGRLHDAIGVCARCGKIACQEEGKICTFCGNQVMSLINTIDKPGTPMDPTDDSALEYKDVPVNALHAARKRVSVLVGMDRTNAERTRVEDADGSWYNRAGNMWLSRKERYEAIRQGLDEERRKIQAKQSLSVADHDIFGVLTIGEIDEETAKLEREMKLKEQLQRSLQTMRDEEQRRREERAKIYNETAASLTDKQQSLFELLKQQVAREVTAGGAFESGLEGKALTAVQRAEDRLLDGVLPPEATRYLSPYERRVREYKDCIALPEECHYVPPTAFPHISDADHMAGDGGDKGVTITMHQPWAGLLIAGIKTLEGRVWQTTHTGRLWIHAAKKQETHDEDVENILKRVVEDARRLKVRMPPLPEHWPTSCLLGCVEVVGNVSIEEIPALAEKGYCLNEGNVSNWQMICWRPQKLPIPIKMSGEHKYWRLPADIHQNARKVLTPVKYPCEPTWTPQVMGGPAKGVELPYVPAVRQEVGGIRRQEKSAPSDKGQRGATRVSRTPSLAEMASTLKETFESKKVMSSDWGNGVVHCRRGVDSALVIDCIKACDEEASTRGAVWFEGFLLPDSVGVMCNGLGMYANRMESKMEKTRNDLDFMEVTALSDKLKKASNEWISSLLLNDGISTIFKKHGNSKLSVRGAHATCQWANLYHISGGVGSGWEPVASPSTFEDGNADLLVIGCLNGVVLVKNLLSGADEWKLRSGDAVLICGKQIDAVRGVRVAAGDEKSVSEIQQGPVFFEFAFKI
eukprot:GDKJ01040300.1.p1 GENE.GDKJ01040300.1~~GDKJ01040300.1.p1  ORF type:complete len:757 (-),score=167.89 GDKJ01040300.1:55-2325(-)